MLQAHLCKGITNGLSRAQDVNICPVWPTGEFIRRATSKTYLKCMILPRVSSAKCHNREAQSLKHHKLWEGEAACRVSTDSDPPAGALTCLWKMRSKQCQPAPLLFCTPSKWLTPMSELLDVEKLTCHSFRVSWAMRNWAVGYNKGHKADLINADQALTG